MIEMGKNLFDVNINYCRAPGLMTDGINITNYEMASRFVDAKLDGLVLDESSILKSVDGVTRNLMLEHFTSVPFRLCCTATPCPNYIAKIANHAEFLRLTKRVEMLAAFFVHDEDGWRLRGHAGERFYKWLASWAMSLYTPADLGFDDSQFKLPPLNIIDICVQADPRLSDSFFGGLKGIGDRARIRAGTVKDLRSRCCQNCS